MKVCPTSLSGTEVLIIAKWWCIHLSNFCDGCICACTMCTSSYNHDNRSTKKGRLALVWSQLTVIVLSRMQYLKVNQFPSSMMFKVYQNYIGMFQKILVNPGVSSLTAISPVVSGYWLDLLWFGQIHYSWAISPRHLWGHIYISECWNLLDLSTRSWSFCKRITWRSGALSKLLCPS